MASKPVLLASASVRVMEGESSVQLQTFRCMWMSLVMKNKNRKLITRLCDVSWDTDYPPPGLKTRLALCGVTPDVTARTLADSIRDYITKEGLAEAVLQSLDLSENLKMSCENLARILELLIDYQIWALDLSSNPHLGDSIVPELQPLLDTKKSHLRDLKLTGCGLTVAGLKRLLKVSSKSRLRLLDISHIRISDESELIEQVMELPMVEQLGFRFCDLSLSDVRTIAENLAFTSVNSLHLAGNAFGSQGLVHLASTLPESMVEELDLSNVGIEAKCEGLSELAKAWVKRPFQKLHLKENPMGQAEVMSFITALRTLMPNEPLDETCMGNVDIGARRRMSVAELRQFLKKCC